MQTVDTQARNAKPTDQMTINEFVKSMREVFGESISYKATKDGQVFTSKNWRERDFRA
jgi:hypothetical protein